MEFSIIRKEVIDMPPIGWPTAREVDAVVKRRLHDPKLYTGRSFCPLVTKMTQRVECWEQRGPLGKTQAIAIEQKSFRPAPPVPGI
jgi:hypothetical protein